MTHTADRFRAYATARGLRKNDQNEMVETDISGEVFLFGKTVPANGVVTFDSGKTKIRRVAFYSGPEDAEVCLGSVEINRAGKIAADIADIRAD